VQDPRGAARSLISEGLLLELVGIEPERIVLRARSCAGGARCPACGKDAARAHSVYTRTIADLPWRGAPVILRVRARRFFCDEPSCERKIFCERLPDVAAHARKTGRLEEALLAIVLELGGRAGSRLAAELGLVVGRDALLDRATKHEASACSGKVRVLGVDDFAFRKGNA
jgi:transposase